MTNAKKDVRIFWTPEDRTLVAQQLSLMQANPLASGMTHQEKLLRAQLVLPKEKHRPFKSSPNVTIEWTKMMDLMKKAKMPQSTTPKPEVATRQDSTIDLLVKGIVENSLGTHEQRVYDRVQQMLDEHLNRVQEFNVQLMENIFHYFETGEKPKDKATEFELTDTGLSVVKRPKIAVCGPLADQFQELKNKHPHVDLLFIDKEAATLRLPSNVSCVLAMINKLGADRQLKTLEDKYGSKLIKVKGGMTSLAAAIDLNALSDK